MTQLAKQFSNWWRGVTLEDKPLCEPEPLYKELPMTSFFASLSPEQRTRALAYRGAEDHGDSEMRCV